MIFGRPASEYMVMLSRISATHEMDLINVIIFSY